MKKLSIFILTTTLIVAIGTSAFAALKNILTTSDWDPTNCDY